MTKDVKITEKTKKTDIIKAYHDLLEDMKNRKVETPKEKQKKIETVEILKEVSSISQENIVKTIGGLKIQITKVLESLEDQMGDQFKRLNNLQKAREVEEKRVEDTHQIQLHADSLQALLEGQKKYKEEFEEEKESEKEDFEYEMEEKRDEWSEEKENMKIILKNKEKEKKRIIIIIYKNKERLKRINMKMKSLVWKRN